MRIGPWTIEEEDVPGPAYVFSATHDDYTGPGDDRHVIGGNRNVHPVIDRARALRECLQELIDFIEEQEFMDVPGSERKKKTSST